MHLDTTIILAIALALQYTASGACYFPVEVQGEFMTQSLAHQEISYTSLSILYNSIPGWGVCHSRHGDRVLLEDATVNGDTCYKCIKLAPRSKNVIQIHSRDIYQCFSTDTLALASCPTSSEVVKKTVGEVMLYKTRGFYGESAVSDVACPITGRWRFTYSNRGDQLASCASPASRASDCPTGRNIDLRFQGCSFPSREMHYKCLGSWKAADGQNYLALMDTELPQLGEEIRPRYRCGIWRSDPSRGYTWLALSNDSTCSHQLDTHSAGYETLQLHSLQQPLEPGQGYSLPEWAQGTWGDSVTVKGGTVTYAREEDFTRYTLHTVSSPRSNHFLVRLDTSCSPPSYACLALHLRADNILELRLGRRGKAPDSQLCQDSAFLGADWETLGRPMVGASCPLQGEYSGALPDADGLCARSVTACGKPQLMQYQVYNCENTTEVYEDRSYLCFGNFSEAGLVYTVVRRLDLPHRECFVGVTMEEGRVSVIQEAGTSCGRGKDPHSNGMMLTKTGGECVQWGWEEEEEKEEEEEEKEEKEEEEGEESADGQREGGGEDIEKVLFDSVTTRTRGSVKEGVDKERSEEPPRRGVPRQASSPDLALPPASPSSSSFSPLPPPVLLNLFLCIICISSHL